MRCHQYHSYLKAFVILMTLTFFNTYIIAQNRLNGKVSDSDGNPAAGVIIQLCKDGKIKSYANSKRDGSFSLKADSTSLPGLLILKSNRYSYKELEISSAADSIFVTLTPEQYTLEEVVVKVPRVRVKGDTITYDVASYTNASDRSIEDVIKKLPGVEVLEGGAIYYDGEPINNFYIEGLNLMGNNYKVASQNINPKDISTISVYERHQPKKVLKNVEPSKRAALNLKLKKSRMIKPVGYVKGSSGFGDDLLWGGNLYTMFISPKNQTIVSAKGNNSGTDYLGDNTSGHKANTLFSRKPFGTPSLSSNKYIDNKSAYFTANTIFKLKEDLTLRLNSYYGLDHDEYGSYSSTEYLASGLENPYFTETVDNGLRKHAVYASMKVEKNSDNLYLMDEVLFSGTFNDNSYDIFNTGDVHQSMHNDHYYFANNFSTAIKLNRRKTLQLDSKTSFQNTPLNRMAAFGGEDNSVNILQNIGGKTFHNEESTGIEFELNKTHRVGTNLSFNFDHDRFSSDAIVGNDVKYANDLSGHNSSLAVSPYYKLTLSQYGVWGIYLPIEWRNQKFTNFLTSDQDRLNKLFVNVKSTLLLKFMQKMYVDVEANFSHDTGNINNFIENPIYTTYRNYTTLGTGALEKTLSKSVRGTYSYREPMIGFFVKGTFSYIYKKSNSLSEFNVNQEGTSTTLLSMNSHSNTTNFIASAIKHVYPIHSRFSLNFSGMWMSRENMRRNSVINVKTNMYVISADASTDQFEDRLSLSLNVSYSINQQKFSNGLPSNNLNETTAIFKISYSPIKKLELYANANYGRVKLTDDYYKTNMFVNAGIRFKPGKFEFELAGKNLTNMKKYEYTIYRTLDIQTFSYNLRPIEGIFSIRYNL